MRTVPAFTLLEMLVALTLLGILMLAGHQVLAVAGRVASLSGQDAGYDFLVRRMVADWVSAAKPWRPPSQRNAPVLFEGEPDRMTFVTDLPQRFGTAGVHRVTLGVTPEGLEITWAPLRAAPPETEPASRLLVPGVRQLSLRYWGASERGSTWSNAWVGESDLPALVEISLEGPESNDWPPSTIALRRRGS